MTGGKKGAKVRRNEELARELKCIAQIRLAKEDLDRYGAQMQLLEKELADHRFNLVLREYLRRQRDVLQEKSDRREAWMREQLVEHSGTWTKIPADIWDSARAFGFFVDDVAMGRAMTVEEAVRCARARKDADPFWYVFGE